MKLHDKQAGDGEALNKKLEKLLAVLEPDKSATVELYAHLWDLHDAATRIEAWIAELATLEPHTDRDRAIRLLYNLRVELFDHTEPHLKDLRPILEDLCLRLVDIREQESS